MFVGSSQPGVTSRTGDECRRDAPGVTGPVAIMPAQSRRHLSPALPVTPKGAFTWSCKPGVLVAVGWRHVPLLALHLHSHQQWGIVRHRGIR